MIKDNHGNEFDAWLEQGELGPLFCVKEKTGKTAGKWSWYVVTLCGLNKDLPVVVPDVMYLDFGQNWYITGIRKELVGLIGNIKLAEPVRMKE